MTGKKDAGRNQKKKRRRLLCAKYVLYVLIGLFLFFLENSWYTLELRTPAWLASYTVLLGMLEGPETGAVCGLICGLLSDAAGGGTLYASPVLYTLYGYFSGDVTERFWKRRFPVYGMLLFCVSALDALVVLLASLFTAKKLLPAGLLFTEYRKNALATLLWGLLLWLPAHRIPYLTDRAGRTVYVKRKANRL